MRCRPPQPPTDLRLPIAFYLLSSLTSLSSSLSYYPGAYCCCGSYCHQLLRYLFCSFVQFFSFQARALARLDLGFISMRTHIYLRVCLENGSTSCHVPPLLRRPSRNNEVSTARTSSLPAAAAAVEYSSSFLIFFFLSLPPPPPPLPLIHSNQDFAREEAKEKFDFGRRMMMAHVVVVVYSDEH